MWNLLTITRRAHKIHLVKIMTQNIGQLIQDEFRKGVFDVSDGKKKEWKGGFVTPEMAARLLTSWGFESHQDFDTNGWEYSWCETYSLENGKEFYMAGCGHNGECEFVLKED